MNSSDKTLRPYPTLSRRSLLKGLLTGAGSVALGSALGTTWSAQALAADKKLSGPLMISNWPYFISPKTVPEFEKKYGVDVKYIEDINSMAGIFAKIAGPLQIGRNPDRDIVILNPWVIERLIGLKWLEPIDYSQIPNAKNLLSEYKNPSWDPHRKFSLPWASFLTGIAYNIKKTGKELTSIEEIFDPAYRGHVGMLNDMRSTLSLVFLSMGVNPSKATDADLKKALAKITANVKNGQIRQFYGNDYVSGLVRGDVWVSMAWSGDIPQVQSDNPDIRFLQNPKEGFQLNSDNMVVPIKAPHFETAMAWMNFIYDPKIYAQIAAFMKYIPPVAHTKEYIKQIDPKLVDNHLIYPTRAMLDKAYRFRTLSAKEQQKWESAFQAVMGH